MDAGTSTGFYAGVLAGCGCQVDAADLSAGMLRQAARRHPSPLISWRQVNLERSGWEADTYDGITVGATLNETACPALFLAEINRLLRPGGGLWLMYVTHAPGPAQTAFGHLGGLHFPDLAWISRHLPGLTLEHATQSGVVQFALWRRSS
ncbi:class I SAM-dependent methyltransferase [Deinococcus malanensis]|uniref:class I SAM-dependent methyltransferase n=1 Tax=Deinococcus malanensis TaxID=1706855 RepID=UPI0036398449